MRSSPLVLVADSHTDCRETLAVALEFSGYEVRTARDSHEAISQLRELTPRAIVLDSRLKGAPGVDVARVLRANQRFDATRIVLTTTWLAPEQAERTRGVRLDAVLCKPIDLGTLLRTLASPAPARRS